MAGRVKALAGNGKGRRIGNALHDEPDGDCIYCADGWVRDDRNAGAGGCRRNGKTRRADIRSR
jgi:hypothetical protein